jgi:GntR family transcriptional repressor for pyruvate dehydrogenase complex
MNFQTGKVMPETITPLVRLSLADNLAQEIKNFIISKGYFPGTKLPPTAKLAQLFGVGLPTVREALKKLETIGAVSVKHGSGIFVGETINSLFLLNPIYSNQLPSKKQLLDLIDARISIELSTAALAAVNANTNHLEIMENLLKEAKENIQNDNILSQKNMLFHRTIASASGNTVFDQILEVITKLFQKEQLLIIDIFRSKDLDHEQHVQILSSIKSKDKEQCVDLMRSHLMGVRESIMNWTKGENPPTKFNKKR